MYIFVLYALLSIWAFWILLKKNDLKERTQLVILWGVSLFFMLRYSYGMDTVSYKRMYETMYLQYEYAAAYGNRFALFNSIIYFFYSIGFTFDQFRIFLNFVFLLPITYVIQKESKNIILSLIILIGSGVIEVYYASALRQMLCMTVFFYAYYCFLKNNRYVTYYLFCIPLIFIQEVSVITLLVPIFYLLFPVIQKNKKFNIMLIILSIAGFILVRSSQAFSIPFISAYAKELLRVGGSFSILGFGLECVLLGLILVLYYFSDHTKQDDFTRFSVYLCFLTFLIYVAAASIPLMSRACDYLQIIHIILIPALYETIPEHKKKSISLAAVIGLNTVLLVTDVQQEVTAMPNVESVMQYSYVPIWDTEQINQFYSSK